MLCIVSYNIIPVRKKKLINLLLTRVHILFVFFSEDASAFYSEHGSTYNLISLPYTALFFSKSESAF